MLLKELMKDEYSAGKKDGLSEGLSQGMLQGMANSIISILGNLCPVSDCLKKRISSIEDADVLSELSITAARVTSVEEFEDALGKMKL